MKILSWLFVVLACAVSAFYLNWIAYQPAAHQDGSVGAVLRLAVRWYGLPAATVVQLLIWYAMPRLFRLSPSPWIAALVWPLISACSKVAVLWPLKRPDRSDWLAIAGMFAALLGALSAK